MALAFNPDGITLEQAIGQVLRNLRESKELSRIDVSVATNFGMSTLKNMEGGKQSMTIRSLDALAMFYEIPIEELIIRAKTLRGE